MERLFECGYISTPERVIFLERLWLVREIKPASTHLHTTYVLNRKTGNYQSEPENKKVAIQDLRATLVEEHCLLTFLSAVAKSCLCVSVCLFICLCVTSVFLGVWSISSHLCNRNNSALLNLNLCFHHSSSRKLHVCDGSACIFNQRC